jgi:hypothetical protein
MTSGGVSGQPGAGSTRPHLALTEVDDRSSQALLDSSLPLKKTEAGLKGVKLWGKFITLNGKDYLLAKVGDVARFRPDGKEKPRTLRNE